MRKKGFTLLETLVTLLTVSIILLMLSNILVLSLQLSIKARERGHAREELTNLVNLIRRDIRNADNVLNDVGDNGEYIEVFARGINIRWEICDSSTGTTQVCQYTCEEDSSTSCDPATADAALIPEYTNTYRSSERINIKTFSLTDLDDTTASDSKSIQITLIADHANANLEILNLYRQIIVSTRNYRI